MEVDSPTPWKESLECTSEMGKFTNMKSFVNAAREFEATHSEASIDLMNRSLGLVSSCDLSVFSPGRPEVCAFFSTLWRIMYDDRSPIWSAVAVLARAINEPNMRHALTHTYKFLPVLSRLLSETISNEKKLKLLSVMQDISYGIKISWQESYLLPLIKQLTQWILNPMSEAQHRVIGHKSLTILVNICYGNLPAVHALMQTVNTKEFIVHLINLKDGGYGGVSVCRLLACVSSAASRAPRPADVHGYIDCTMRIFNKAVAEKDGTQLLHAYIFMNDLCSDDNTKNFVLTYPNFPNLLKDTLQEIEKICKTVSSGTEHTGSIGSDLNHILKYLTVLISLDESCLPSEIVSLANEFLAPVLDPCKTGLQWLQVVGALCEMTETQEKVLSGVTPESFEDILYSVLHYSSQNGIAGIEQSQQAAILGCRIALSLAPLARPWDSALARMLAHHQVRKMLCTSLTGGGAARRRQVLHLIKHHYFPSDQMNQRELKDETTVLLIILDYEANMIQHESTNLFPTISSNVKAQDPGNQDTRCL
ncbi:hypothetical protein EVAR_4269_1 [Eumeta japonica]|uniref:Uncharacterized protein n=1 Tax=Eumeta variegata TaxID=151549 RepID=A0A4C1Z9K2_EUMVA|nr:hypothetical protein EVAR_4269_1 [Eumeta japonica]